MGDSSILYAFLSSARRRSRTFGAFLFGALLTGCAAVLGFDDTTLRTEPGDDAGDAGDADIADTSSGDAGQSRVTVSPASVIARRGGTVDVTVTIDRGADLRGPLTATLSDLPSGITAAPATASDAETTTKLTITAAKTAALGATTAHVTVSPSTLPPIDLPLLVADAAGSLDVTFNGNGSVSDATHGVGSVVYAVALQDSAIVAGGAGGNGVLPPAGWFVRRVTAAGALDATFTTPSGLPADGELRAVAVDAQHRVVCVGSSTPGVAQAAQLTVVRLGPNGAADASFAGGAFRLGAAEAPTGSNAWAVAVQPDGAIVIAGSRKDSTGGEDGIALRLKDNGTRDTAFAGGLVAVAKTRFVGVSVETSGAITLAGTDSSGTPSPTSYVVTRRTSAGAIDSTFGTSGKLLFGVGFRADGFARLGDGSFALVGESVSPGNLYTAGVATNAGAQTWVRGVASGTGAGFFAAAGQSDGRVVAVGHTAGAGGEARVERILPDTGAVDTTFGNGGAAILEAAGAHPAFDVSLFATLVQPDGRIVAGGNQTNAGAILYRLWP